MKKMFTRFALVAAAMLSAHLALAAQYPPGPGGSCPESVTVERIQNPAALCHPATGDTVYGVGGIITGFDAIPTGFGFYIQNSQGGPWTGVDVFTHGTNFKPSLSLEIGDSIVVEVSKTAEFQNGTEIFATNNNFSAPNIVLRKVSSGNALPPFFQGTTTQLNVLPTNTFAEQYEGCLVKVTAAMAVARTYLQNVSGGATNMPFGTFYLVDPAASSDSLMVDGATLFSYAPPAVGTPVSMVQGILEQRTGGYRVQLRSGNDIVTNTPPGVNDAYSITNNQVRVVFDRDVTTATATDASNYSLGSFGTVSSAVLDGQSAVILTVSSLAARGNEEVVTINGIEGLANGVTMSAPTSRTYINEVLTCAEMTAPNPDTLTLSADCYDMTKYGGLNFQNQSGRAGNGPFGPRSTFTGICAGQFGNLFYMVDPGAPLRGGITLFAPPVNPVVGRKYTVAGAAQEFVSETEYAAVQYIRDDGPAALPAATTLPVYLASKDTCDRDQNILTGEDYESMIVRLANVEVFRRFTPRPTNGFHVRALTQGFKGDTIFVQNLNSVLGASDSLNPNYPVLGKVVHVTGVLHYDSGSFRVCPRSAADIVEVGTLGVPTTPASLTFSVFPNPARRATLSFALPFEADVELGVFDVSGRQVATLVKGVLPAGQYTRQWAGRDGSGRELGAGVYFIRLKAGNDTRMSRTVILGN